MKGQTQAKTKKKIEEKVYELEPGPFELLDDNERDRLENEFEQLLNLVDRGTIIVSSKQGEYEYENEKYPIIYNKFLLITTAELQEYNKTKLERPKITKVHPDYVELENGLLAQSAVFYRFPDIVPEGFLAEYFGLGDIVFKWEALDPVSAASAIDRTRKRLESSQSNDSFTIRKLQKITQLQGIIGGQAKLLRFWCYIIYYGETKGELRDKFNQIRAIAKSRLFDLDIPRFYQGALYNFRTDVDFFVPFYNSVRPHYVDTITASWQFYPLISEDLIDGDGIFLGFSDSGSPVLFNPYRRKNYNVIILGETGSGKSMTAKIFLKRMKKHLGIKVWGIDPENEYTKIQDVLGVQGIVVRKNTKLGLDLFRLSRIQTDEGRLIDIEDIAEILSDFYLPQDIALRNRLRALVRDNRDADNIFEFVERIERQDPDVAKYLKAISAPPDSYIFDGDLTIEDEIIFGLKEISGYGASRLKALITTLLTIIFQKLMFSNKEKGYMLIDEAWLFVNYQTTMSLLENISRRARKYNKGLLFVTQRPYDVAATEAGKTILEQSATAILLGQREKGVKTLKEIYGIREEEANTLLSAEAGHGILRTGNYLLRIYVQPSKEEFELFKTTGEW
ncbi:VirB4 family type IV secretion system protein [Sulfurisphaera ohwakuensis]|uniref:VirB4 family type IV secretion system protein n=1 Tax=Sulfurisphaera ohwakuensis TaxID=69656 RepID=UPI0036F2707B